MGRIAVSVIVSSRIIPIPILFSRIVPDPCMVDLAPSPGLGEPTFKENLEPKEKLLMGGGKGLLHELATTYSLAAYFEFAEYALNLPKVQQTRRVLILGNSTHCSTNKLGTMASSKRSSSSNHIEKIIRHKEEQPVEPELPKYRDRAKERREDQNPDYEASELGSFHAVAPPRTVDLLCC
ncbi:hypothetical protein Vadar_005339 [Vaccinium darrowii]|uniref:Uncharacterized protein n=1 Tax=Vaccinium darrowii TaxID=229202 RepID=A0ACB7XFH6_9ERIC|nr:hypothetical protein Vadar_005339 [Vaccinium darrowii]